MIPIKSFWLSGNWVGGGGSACYYYMKPRVKRKNLKELLLSIKKLLEALKGV